MSYRVYPTDTIIYKQKIAHIYISYNKNHGMGNNPMVGATVAVAVSVEEAATAGKF